MQACCRSEPDTPSCRSPLPSRSANGSRPSQAGRQNRTGRSAPESVHGRMTRARKFNISPCWIRTIALELLSLGSPPLPLQAPLPVWPAPARHGSVPQKPLCGRRLDLVQGSQGSTRSLQHRLGSAFASLFSSSSSFSDLSPSPLSFCQRHAFVALTESVLRPSIT